jgi:prepilin-type N-terminal cleavage/methylation domain-containing protein
MKAQGRKKLKGYTLIELTIVIIVIAVLVAIAIPRFMQASTKSKQTEAKLILKQICVMQRAYRQENNVYFPGDGSTIVAQPGGIIAPLGVEIMSSVRYSYSIIGDANSYSATAGCKDASGLDDDPALDVWTINQTGVLTCLTDDSQN